MNKSLLQLALVGILVLMNAAFAGSEMALISLREGQLQRLERQSRAGRLLAQLARNPNRFLATIQVGITLAGFLASATAAVALAKPLEAPLGFLGDAAEAAAIVLVTLALTFVTLVFGELAPKRVAMQRAERWALLAARPLSALAAAARPVIWLLGRATDLAVRLVGADPSRQREEVTQEELHELVAAQSSFSQAQRAIITGAFEVGDRNLREILVPRRNVFVLADDMPVPVALRALADSGHSRAPVAPRGNLDEIVGVVHLRELVGDSDSAGQRSHPAFVLPETVNVVTALRRLQTERQQLAIVVNEHGATEGIVTIEDLLEEVVGEIYDETDPDVRGVERGEDGLLTVPGSFPIHDLDDIGVYVPDGAYATIAGLILDRLGHIPEAPGESVEIAGWTFRVVSVEARAITRVQLSRRGRSPVWRRSRGN